MRKAQTKRKPRPRSAAMTGEMTVAAQRMRENVLELLNGGAHLDFDRAVEGLSAKLRGAKPAGQPHTPWRLIEHMRMAQEDILRFSADATYESPPWPEGYWPEEDGPPSSNAWDESIRRFRADRAAMEKLVGDPKVDLLAPIPHGSGQTLLREAMLIADHNAYHVGQLVMVRRMLGDWGEG